MTTDPIYEITAPYVIVTDPAGRAIRYKGGARVPQSKLYTAPRHLQALVDEGAVTLAGPDAPPPQKEPT